MNACAVFIIFIGFIFVFAMIGQALEYIIDTLTTLELITENKSTSGIEIPFQWLMITLLFPPIAMIAAFAYSLLISIFLYYAEDKDWFNRKISAASYGAFTPFYMVGMEIFCQSPSNLCYI